MRPSTASQKPCWALGIQKGDHVAVWATNWPKWILLQFATARIGAVMVLINPAYRTSELAYVLKQSDAVALFLVDAFRTSDYFAMVSEAVPELGCVAVRVQLDAGGIPAAAARRLDEADADAGDVGVGRLSSVEERTDFRRGLASTRIATGGQPIPINIQYTSGTTGFPKGAMLTHRNLLLNAFYVGECRTDHGVGSDLHSGSVLSLLRLRAGNAVLRRSTERR